MDRPSPSSARACLGPRVAEGLLARTGLHRRASQRRRGCALQRCSKPSRDHPYCSRSPTVWHDRIAPDADQRHAAEDAHRARGCTEPSPKPWHARHTFRRSVPLPCKARGPRSVEVESAHRRRRPAPRARPAVRETLSAARERKVSCLKFSALQSRKGSPRPGRKM